MSVYSGFALRKQETRYNNLLNNLILLLSDKLSFYFSKESEHEASFKYRFGKIILVMKQMEDQKYLPPKFSTAATKLYDLLDIQNVSVHGSICVSQMGTYDENESVQQPQNPIPVKSKSPSPVYKQSMSPYEMSLIKGLGGKGEKSNYRSPRDQKNHPQQYSHISKNSIEIMSPNQYQNNSFSHPQNSNGYFPQVSSFQQNEVPVQIQQQHQYNQQKQSVITLNQQHPDQQMVQYISQYPTQLPPQQQQQQQQQQEYQSPSMMNQRVYLLPKSQPQIYENQQQPQPFHQQLQLTSQQQIQLQMQQQQQQQQQQNFQTYQQYIQLEQIPQQVYTTQQTEYAEQEKTQQSQMSKKKKKNGKKVDKHVEIQNIVATQDNHNIENGKIINRSKGCNIQYITNSNVKIIDNSKIQLVIENDSTNNVQVQDFLQNAPIDSYLQNQQNSDNSLTPIHNGQQAHNQSKYVNNSAVSNYEKQNSIEQYNSGQQDIDFESEHAILNGDFSHISNTRPLQERNQLLNSSIQSQSKRYLPLVSPMQSQPSVYMHNTKHKNTTPEKNTKQANARQKQNQHLTTSNQKKNLQNESVILDKQKLLQKTITEKMINMTQIFEQVQGQNPKQNQLKLNHSQINFPTKQLNDDISLPSIQPQSTTSKKSTLLTKDLSKINQLKSDFLILNKTKDLNESIQEEETPHLNKTFVNITKRSLSTNTGYNDANKSPFIQDKGYLTQFQKKSFIRNTNKSRDPSLNKVPLRKNVIKDKTLNRSSFINQQNTISPNNQIDATSVGQNTVKDLTRFSFANSQSFHQEDTKHSTNLSELSQTKRKKAVNTHHSTDSESNESHYKIFFYHTKARRLQIKLEEQEKQQNLILNDIILNEQNCQVIAEFLSKFNHFQTIELKGNNITSSGFTIIGGALQSNQDLKELYLEWNQIGQDSQEGLQALLQLLDYNSNLTHIDLKNNNISSDGAYIISKILEANRNLLSLDLKWNEIGVKGAEMILEGLEKNTTIKSIDISCNKIPEEMIAEVNRILNRNRSGNFANMNISRPPRQAPRVDKNEPIRIQENFNTQGTQGMKNSMNISQQQEHLNTTVQNVNVYPQEGQQSAQGQQQYQSRQQQEKKQSMNQIEKMLQNEKKRVHEMKERIESELQEEKRVREQFEVNLLKIRDSVLQKEGVISGLQLDFNNLVNENNYLRNDLDKVKADLSVLQEKYSQAIEGLQEHISNNNKVVATLERDHMEIVANVTQDNQRNMTTMIREWSSRYNSLDEKYISLKSINEDLKDKINIVREQMLKLRLENDDTRRNLKIRIEDDIQRKYEIPIKNVENAIRVAQEQREEILRKNSELVKDINYKEDKYHTAILNLERDIAEQRQQLNGIHNKLSVRNMKIESHKTKHVAKDDQIQDLEEELIEAQRAQQRQKEDNKEKQEYIIFQHNNEKKLFKESQEVLHQRVLELERSIRNQEQQNSRLKTEYEKLCHVLQNNIQRSVVDTLAHESHVLHAPHLIQQAPQVIYSSIPHNQIYNQQLPPQM